MSGVTTVAVEGIDSGLRLDRWFKRHYPGLGHGQLQKLLRTGQVRVDGKRAAANQRLEAGQTVRVPPLGETATSARPAAPVAPRPLNERDAKSVRDMVLYRDDDVIALNKPAGLPVQGGPGIARHLDAMLDALRFDAPERPRLVHRLDRDTSGVLLLGRSAAATAKLAEAFRHKTARKLYWAVVAGVPKPREGRIDLALAKVMGRGGERVAPVFDGDEEEGGKRAITLYRVVEHVRKASWLAMLPLTGRTHQLRVHCAYLGTPILGDGKYGGQEAFLPFEELPKQLHLHARTIRLPHPRGGTLEVTAPLSDHMRETWAFFGFDPENDGGALEAFPE